MTQLKQEYDAVIYGAGAFGTSLAQCMVHQRKKIYLVCRSKAVEREINENHTNSKYLPGSILSPDLEAISQDSRLIKPAIIFFAVPSNSIIDVLEKHCENFHEESILVNLAKGLHSDGSTITSAMEKYSRQPICSLKGPTFSNELISHLPSALTLAYSDEFQKSLITSLFKKSNISLDYTTDVTGVEYLGALKNIYAIVIGIVDAYSNSANTRFMVLTKAANEAREALMDLGARSDTLLKYCGIGDLGLTALNDQSRNRTLGLLIGKGFFSFATTNNIILEGLNSLSIFVNLLPDTDKYPLLMGLYNLIYNNLTLHEFYVDITSS
jgi:glycerol-3-phosphate dehydrogenase (NAD(P)+)